MSSANNIRLDISIDNQAKIQRNFKQLRGFSGQKRSIRDAAYKALTPVVKEMKKEAPARQEPYTGKQALTKRPGTLKRSIGKKKARNSPVAIAGPRRGKSQKNDGWYAPFLEDGATRKKQGTIEARRFRDKSMNRKKSEMNKIMSAELDKAFDKYVQKNLRK